MSLVKQEDGKKWINSLIAVIALLSGFVTIRFIEQMGEWFDLEAKVGNFLALTQGAGILVGVLTFVLIFKNTKASTMLKEVYAELVKVVWPDKDSVLKITVGLVIGLSIVSAIFVLVDFTVRKILELIY